MKKWSLILCLFLLWGCKTERRKIDVSNSDIKTIIQRFDIDFWNIDLKHFRNSIGELQKKYPQLLPLYTEQALNIGEWDSNDCEEILTNYFYPDSTIQSLYIDCLKKYSDVSDLNKALSKAFQRANAVFPEKNIPEIYFHVSAGANPNPILYKDSLISLSIDNYLGEDYPLYQNAVYGYLRYNMRREKVVPDIVTIWLARNFPFSPQSGQLLDEMLYRGKIMYLLATFLPDESEANLMGYTPEQWQWCCKQEKDLWMSIVERKHLFSTEGILITKYLNDAPFTSYFSQESPGRCGVFIGWRIIESYMKNNPKVSLQELMNNTDYKTILEQSVYNP